MIIKLECGGDCKKETAGAARLKELLRERRARQAAGQSVPSTEEILARVRAEIYAGTA